MGVIALYANTVIDNDVFVRRSAGRYRQSRRQVTAVAALVLALVLRLPWTAPIMADPARGLAAAFGEHALCLAAAGNPSTRPGGESPAEPGSHPDHDPAKCCQSHAPGAVVLPDTGSAIRILFARPNDRFAAGAALPTDRSLGHAWARAPPFAAG